MRGIVNGVIIMTIMYALTFCAFVLPHHPCDVLTPLPWLHCNNDTKSRGGGHAAQRAAAVTDKAMAAPW